MMAGEVPDARRVWMIIPSFCPIIGGAEIQAGRLSLALLERGWTIRVLTRRDTRAPGPRLSRHEDIDGVPVIRVDSRGYGKIASLRYLLGGLQVLGSQGPGEIYHAHDIGAPGLLAGLASRLFNGRSVVKLRTGARVYQARLAAGPRRWIFRSLLRLHDRIIVVNSEVEELLTGFGIPADRIVRIPNGIDGEAFRKGTPVQRRDARLSLNLPLDRKVVLCVARLVHVKGVDVLLSAWALLPEGLRKESVLVIVGDGPARRELARLAHSRAIEDSTILAGEQSRVQDYYRAADLFVLPSRTEGLSNALLEAMASELPVIATAVGGTRDVVQNGVSGVLVSPEDEQDLSRALQLLLSRPCDWPRLGVEGRKEVLEHADLRVILEKIEAVYAGLA